MTARSYPLPAHRNKLVRQKKTIDLLKHLSENEQNEVVIVSGRKRDTLEAWLGKLPLGLVAEHGGYRKENGNSWIQNSVVMLDWKENILPLFVLYQARCAGTIVEEKELSLAWHYRNADKELGAIRARELLIELHALPKQDNFTIMEGNKVIEIRCKNVHKGSGIKYWLNKDEYDFIFCIGDDQTDEDMFRALPANAFSFRVGLKQSQARFHLPSQPDALEFLNKLSPALLPYDKHNMLS